MNRKAEYFERYEALAAVSGRMLGAARSADWSALPGLQAEFMQLVDGLKEADPGVVLDESDLGRKLDLIRRILQRGVDRGEFRVLDMDYALFSITAPMVFLVMMKHSLGACAQLAFPLDPERYIASQLDTLVLGLCVRKEGNA